MDCHSRNASTAVGSVGKRRSYLLMRTLAERGQSAEALRVYAGLQERLRDELGTAPSAQTKQLHEQLLRGVP